MKQGKNTCRILKEIRRQIASANDIDYVVDECQYKGDCSGTCPHCEDEVRYLEQQLQHKQSIGKVVSVVGLSLSIAAISTQLSSCGSTTQPAQSNQSTTSTEAAPELDAAIGAMPIDEPQTETTKDATPTKAARKPRVEPEILDGLVENDFGSPMDTNVSGELQLLRPKEEMPLEYMEQQKMGKMLSYADSLSLPARFVDGGEQGLTKFIAQHAKMPEGVDSTKQYTIYASITINKDGLADPTSIKNLNIFSDNKEIQPETYPQFKQEIARLIKLMPKWEPARRDLGRNIAEPYASPVYLYVILNSDNAASSTYR